MNSKNIESLRPITDLTLAWEKYLQSGFINDSAIEQPIIESWNRSNEANVNPLDGD